jgi:hypothetical protein
MLSRIRKDNALNERLLQKMGASMRRAGEDDAHVQSDLAMLRDNGAPTHHHVDPNDTISRVEVGADDDANPTADDNNETTFVYTEGADVPNDVVRLRVDPSVEVISPEACMGRKKIIEVIVPEGNLRVIGYRAFAHCTALKGVLYLPSTLKTMQQGAFECCKSLTEVIFRGSKRIPINDVAFGGCTALLEQARRKMGSDTIRILLKERQELTEEERRTVPNDRNTTRALRIYIYDVYPNDVLKWMFDTFCKDRGTTLRSLRLSYKGKTVFLSDMKNKTPIQLGMRNDHENSEISVLCKSDKAQIDSMTVRPQHALQRGKTKKKSGGVRRGPSKVKKERVKKEEPITSLGEYKRSHSMILTRLHEEVQPRLNEIRMKLNALELDRQPPKLKSKYNKKGTRNKPNDRTLQGDGVSGKAGKSFFVVQVGEVENLYKTTKPTSSLAYSSGLGQSCVPTLDLHGCTREEAVVRLNESVKVWVDTAMRGYYPFVITAVIICGCGSQVLMETVQEWIKSTSQVRNAPKK